MALDRWVQSGVVAVVTAVCRLNNSTQLPTPWSKRTSDTPSKPLLAAKDGPDSPASRLPTPKRRNIRMGRVRMQIGCPTPAAAAQLFHDCFDAVVDANVVSLGSGIEVEFVPSRAKTVPPVKVLFFLLCLHVVA